MRLRYTAEARAHIEAINDYITERNPVAARRTHHAYQGCCRPTCRFPYIGHAGLVPGIREWVVIGRRASLFDVNAAGNEVVIMGVFHGAQNREEE